MGVPNSVMSELVTVALRNRQKKMYDNMSQHNALFNRLNKNGGIRKLDGDAPLFSLLTMPRTRRSSDTAGMTL